MHRYFLNRFFRVLRLRLILLQACCGVLYYLPSVISAQAASAQAASAQTASAQAASAQAASAQTKPNSVGEKIRELNQRAVRISTLAPDAALRSAKEALDMALEHNLLAEQAQANATIGVVLRFQDRYDSALVYQEKAVRLFSDLKDSSGLANSFVNLGGIYQSRGNYAPAMEMYFQALTLFETINNKQGIAKARASIGVAYFLKGEYPKALDFQRSALSMRLEIGDEQGIAHSLRNIGNVQEQMKNLDSAVTFFEAALSRFEKIGDAQGVAISLGSLGAVFARLGERERSRFFHLKAIPLQEQLGDKRGLAVVHNNIAEMYLRDRSYNDALRYARRALALGEEIGAWAEQRDASKRLSDVYAALGNVSLAFQYFKKYVILKDSIENVQNSQRIADLQTRYDLAEKDRTIAKAENARNLERLNAENSRKTLVIASVVFVAILGLALNGYRIKRRSENILKKQNNEILRQQDLLRQQAEEISRANQELQSANTLLGMKNGELSLLNQEKNEFLGIAAHDLKNPLANMLLTVQLLEEFQTKADKDKFREWTQSITRSVEYMLNIIGNLLDVNKIEAGKMEMDMQTIDVVSMVALTVDAYTFRAQEKGIVLDYQIAQDPAMEEKISVLADTNALQQVLENLISNALKFSLPGKNVFIRVRSSNNYSSTIRIEIQDEGPGISEDDMKKLFGKFARLSARPTGGEHSTGLGLSIVKKMVEAMNGRVWCESELGKGATFIVELLRR